MWHYKIYIDPLKSRIDLLERMVINKLSRKHKVKYNYASDFFDKYFKTNFN